MSRHTVVALLGACTCSLTCLLILAGLFWTRRYRRD